MSNATATKAPTTVWVGINGESYCTAHAPYSLASAIKASPRAANHVTDNNDWMKFNADEAPCEDGRCA